ncbi:hypothetical protein RCO48_14355 [Peribacillus frigoritolerans]|nr:hypothetical protein [Peribacillus frigoritolerans]
MIPMTFLELENERTWIEEIYQAGGKTLKQVAVDLPMALDNDWFKRSPLTEILGEALREWSQADCSFLNAGLLLEGLPKGTCHKRGYSQNLPTSHQSLRR